MEGDGDQCLEEIMTLFSRMSDSIASDLNPGTKSIRLSNKLLQKNNGFSPTVLIAGPPGSSPYHFYHYGEESNHAGSYFKKISNDSWTVGRCFFSRQGSEVETLCQLVSFLQSRAGRLVREKLCKIMRGGELCSLSSRVY